MENPRFCRRCLLKDLGDGEYFQNVYEYIASLREEVRAAPEEMERRLAQCRACGELVNGMCRLCGCFVEARAAKRVQRCPGTPPRW